MRSYVPKKGEIESNWFVVDAEGLVLGRLTTRLARILMGKEKPVYTPFLDTGDHVIVVNADKVVLTGNKEEEKVYRRHSGYPGALKERTARMVRKDRPEDMIAIAVRGMLPKTRLGRKMIKKLKVYRGSEHPHQAQKPQQLEIA